MRTGRLVVSSRFLVVPIITALTLLAWGSVAGAGTPFQKKVGKVAIVAQSGGDYTSPVAAMNDVSTWCGAPSETNLCLVKIMPGVYDLAGGSLTMQPYVDIEGSGETATIISSSVHSSGELRGVVNGASSAEIRFLTVKNAAIYGEEPWGSKSAIVNSGNSPKITHVTAIASGGNFDNGVSNYNSSPIMINVTATSPDGGDQNIGVYNNSSSPTMINVTAIASNAEFNYGVYNDTSSPTMSNVTATVLRGNYSAGVYNDTSSPTMSNVTATANGAYVANYGVINSSSSINADQSTFEGSTNSVVVNSDTILNIGGSKLIGTVSNSGTLTCVASYNVDYVALGTNCQPLP